MSAWLRAGAVIALLAVAAGGCRDGGPSKEERPPSPTPPGSGARGIKVPLPPGWAARATPEEALVAGPAGKTVLRIELRSEVKTVPTADALVANFRERIPTLSVQVIDSQSDNNHSLSVLEVGPALDGGAAGPRWLTLLGAKRLGKDLFLCSTAPGSSEDEVKAAAAACGGLERTGTPP
ncbi:MAG: hypothetical protein M3Y59_13800 [Myxococcota bacterium]|nr:hypothetical protein [Myxococcota bacterium]